MSVYCTNVIKSYFLITVKREMLAAIIFGGFENITIWQKFNLVLLLEASGWGPHFFHLATINLGERY